MYCVGMPFQTLDNGIRFISLRNPNVNSVIVMVGVKVGSRNEIPEMHGASHFIEHMLFKGTKKRPTAREISSLIESRGGHNNAYTDKELTNFFVQMSKYDADVALDITHDMLQNSLFRTSDVNKERPVIQEEIAGYDNDPDTKAWHTSEAWAFEGSTLAHPIAGTVKSVEFSADELRKFYHHHYSPDRMVVVLSGAVDPKLEASAQRKFGSLKPREVRGPVLAASIDMATFRPFDKTRSGLTFVEGKTDRIHMIARLDGAAKYTVNERKIQLAVTALGGGSASRLFQEAREKRGLCYGIFAQHHAYSDTGSVVISTDTEQPKFDEMLRTVTGELRKFSRRGITSQELKDAKTQLRGTTLMSLDRPMGLADRAVYQAHLVGHYIDPDTMLAKFMKLRLDDVNESVSKMTPESMHVTVVGPAKAEKIIRQSYKREIG